LRCGLRERGHRDIDGFVTGRGFDNELRSIRHRPDTAGDALMYGDSVGKLDKKALRAKHRPEAKI
jgi:hypothetical protein